MKVKCIHSFIKITQYDILILWCQVLSLSGLYYLFTKILSSHVIANTLHYIVTSG